MVKNGFDLSNQFPKWYRLWIGPYLMVILNRPEQAELVLKSPHALDKGRFYRSVKLVIGGDGLFTSGGKLLLPFLLTFFDTFGNTYFKKNYSLLNTNRACLEQPSTITKPSVAKLFTA